MSDQIEASFHEDGSVYVYNKTTKETTTFDQDSPLHVKLSSLGIKDISEEELDLFKNMWNDADRARMHGKRVEYALENTFGLKVRKTKNKLPVEVGSVVSVKLHHNSYWEMFTLGKDARWRNGEGALSPSELEEIIDEIGESI